MGCGKGGQQLFCSEAMTSLGIRTPSVCGGIGRFSANTLNGRMCECHFVDEVLVIRNNPTRIIAFGGRRIGHRRANECIMQIEWRTPYPE
jgi:hypothetical protein